MSADLVRTLLESARDHERRYDEMRGAARGTIEDFLRYAERARSEAFTLAMLALADALAERKPDCLHEWVQTEASSPWSMRRCRRCGAEQQRWCNEEWMFTGDSA